MGDHHKFYTSGRPPLVILSCKGCWYWVSDDTSGRPPLVIQSIYLLEVSWTEASEEAWGLAKSLLEVCWINASQLAWVWGLMGSRVYVYQVCVVIVSFEMSVMVDRFVDLNVLNTRPVWRSTLKRCSLDSCITVNNQRYHVMIFIFVWDCIFGVLLTQNLCLCLRLYLWWSDAYTKCWLGKSMINMVELLGVHVWCPRSHRSKTMRWLALNLWPLCLSIIC